MKKYWHRIAILAVAAIFMVAISTCANASEMEEKLPIHERVHKCTTTTVFKGYGWSALYGGLLLGGTAALGVAIAPVSVPTSVATGVIVGDTIIGALLGVGSSAVTRISDSNEIGSENLAQGCMKKIAKEKASEVKAAVKDGAAKAAEAGNSVIDRAKKIVN